MSLYNLIYYILIIDLSSRSGTELCAHPGPRRGGPTIGHDSKAGQRPDIKRDQPTPALADGGEARLNRRSGAVAALARSARLRCRRSRQASVRELTDWLRCLTRSRQRPFPLHTRNPLNPDGRRKPIVLGTAVVRRVRSCALALAMLRRRNGKGDGYRRIPKNRLHLLSQYSLAHRERTTGRKASRMVNESLPRRRRNLALGTHLQQRLGGIRLIEVIFDLEHINTRLVANPLRTNGSCLFQHPRKISLEVLGRPDRVHSIPPPTKIRTVTF